MGFAYNMLVQTVLGLYIEDTQRGIKLYPRHLAEEFFERLRNFGWAHDVEILKIAKHFGVDIVELPIRLIYVQGSNIRPIFDSVRMFSALFSIRMNFYIYHILGYGRIRNKKEEINTLYERASLIIFIVAIIMTYIIFPDSILNVYNSHNLSFFTEQNGGRYQLNLLDSLVELCLFVFPFYLPEVYRIIYATGLLLCIFGFWRIVHIRWGPRWAFWIASVLILYTQVAGCAPMLIINIPLAIGFIWSFLYLF